jgi:hypothetical protein
MDEVFPRPIRLPGQPEPPSPAPEERRQATPKIVDEPIDAYGAEAAAADLLRRLEQVRSGAPRVTDDGVELLSPPSTPGRDHIDGPSGRPRRWSSSAHTARRRHARSGGCWPPCAPAIRPPSRSGGGTSPTRRPTRGLRPRAGGRGGRRAGRFWALTRELLAARHHDPSDLSAAMVRAGLDPARTLDAIRAGTGADRIVADTTGALERSGVHPDAVHRRRALPARAGAGGRVGRAGAGPRRRGRTSAHGARARRPGRCWTCRRETRRARRHTMSHEFTYPKVTEIRRVSLATARPPDRRSSRPSRPGRRPVFAPRTSG